MIITGIPLLGMMPLAPRGSVGQWAELRLSNKNALGLDLVLQLNCVIWESYVTFNLQVFHL